MKKFIRRVIIDRAYRGCKHSVKVGQILEDFEGPIPDVETFHSYDYETILFCFEVYINSRWGEGINMSVLTDLDILSVAILDSILSLFFKWSP